MEQAKPRFTLRPIRHATCVCDKLACAILLCHTAFTIPYTLKTRFSNSGRCTVVRVGDSATMAMTSHRMPKTVIPRCLLSAKRSSMVEACLRLEPSPACGRNPLLGNRNCACGIECHLLGLPLVAKLKSRQRPCSIMTIISE